MLRQMTLVALLAVIPATATAQDAQDIEPTWRVVVRDGVPVRCGPESVFYALTELSAGRMLQVDGIVGDQARVRYPEDLPALVPADEVRVIDDRTVELVRASALRAPSMLLGLSGSWKALYPSDLPAGTRLTVRETIRSDSNPNQVVGYRVSPPRPPAVEMHPRAFVPADALRDATPAEVAAHVNRQPATGRPATERPAAQQPAQPANQPANQPSNQPTPPAEQPAQPEQASGRPAGDNQPAEGGTPGAGPDESLLEPMEEPETPDQQTADEPDTGPAIAPSKLEDLEASFEAARRLPPEQLDEALTELLAEYNRTRAEAADDERLAAQLDMRIEWLKLRIATRDQRNAIRAALATADERSKALESQVSEWRSGRAYQLVGRLVLSTVYNGERLPRMYRVQAVTSFDGVPRTLGYLMPDESLSAKLGKVVGIVGEPRFDPQLRLVIIRPDQVDVMPE